LRENRPPSCDETKAGGQQADGIVLTEFAIPAASERKLSAAMALSTPSPKADK
jgi:hypothetical protein